MNALFSRKAKRDVVDDTGQIVESTDSRPVRYYLNQITDAGSVPCSTTTSLLRVCEEVVGMGRGPVRALLLPTRSNSANREARQIE